MTTQPIIMSFVVRLSRLDGLEGEDAGTCWRISVRHVQTGEEAQFADLARAFGYIQQWADEATPDAG